MKKRPFSLISFVMNSWGPFRIAKLPKMQRLPTLIKFAHFLGAITIKGKKQRARKRKKIPRQNKPMK